MPLRTKEVDVSKGCSHSASCRRNGKARGGWQKENGLIRRQIRALKRQLLHRQRLKDEEEKEPQFELASFFHPLPLFSAPCNESGSKKKTKKEEKKYFLPFFR